MNKFLILTLLLTSFTSFAFERNQNHNYRRLSKDYQPNTYCLFDVTTLNSPVKESVARFLIKTPKGFDIDEISFQIKNSGRIFEKVKNYQKINLVDGPAGKELRISVSKLSPGFYQLLVKVKDKKTKIISLKIDLKIMYHL